MTITTATDDERLTIAEALHRFEQERRERYRVSLERLREARYEAQDGGLR